MKEELLQIIEEYFDETGDIIEGRRVVEADLLRFRDWLKTKVAPHTNE